MIAEALFWGLLAHLVGDYVIQSDWMASEKTKAWPPALAHAASYGLPFAGVLGYLHPGWGPSVAALAVIVGTHAVIDHYRLARHLAWAKNQVAPAAYRSTWDDCRATGYPADKPAWMAVWLMIIADNTCHLVLNSAALTWAATYVGGR